MKIKYFYLLILIVLLVFLLFAYSNKNHSGDVKTITISALGDCTLGKNYKMKYDNSWNYKFETLGAKYFLKDVSSVLKNDDITIANLEGVLSDGLLKRQKMFYNEKSNRICVKKYSHLGKSNYLQALKLGGVDVLTFANNHNIDYGLQGFVDTISASERSKIPIAYYDNTVRYKVKGLNVGIISVDATYSSLSSAKDYLRAGISELRRNSDLVIACVHWGKNYETTPNKEQQELGHLCIDLGADLVLGHHAHILQGVERYNGRYIFYSLGNFTYGGRAVPKDVDTIIAQQTFTFIDKTLQIDDNVKIIPCWISSKNEINDFCPIIKNGVFAQNIIKKINSRSEQFGMIFDINGNPVVPKAQVKKRVLEQRAEGVSPQKIPTIIHRLLDLSSKTKS